MTSCRYAIYFAPNPDSLLWRLGSSWLGRDAATGRMLAQPSITGMTASDVAAITEMPARYGFHATLKPPFRLREGTTEAEFLRDVKVFAATRSPTVIPGLRVRTIRNFVALTLPDDIPAVSELAAAGVEVFDPYRAPQGEKELEKRFQAGLSSREEKLLQRWGYPFVMDAYRFHMTLTGALSAAEADKVCAALASHFATVTSQPVTVDAIAVFEQRAPDASFLILGRFPFRAGGF